MLVKKRRSKLGPERDEPIDGGEDRVLPPGGSDERRPTGFTYASDFDADDVDHLWEESGSERRRDPLRGR
jgi:hypothetical protein